VHTSVFSTGQIGIASHNNGVEEVQGTCGTPCKQQTSVAGRVMQCEVCSSKGATVVMVGARRKHLSVAQVRWGQGGSKEEARRKQGGSKEEAPQHRRTGHCGADWKLVAGFVSDIPPAICLVRHSPFSEERKDRRE